MTTELSWQYNSHFVWFDAMDDKEQMDKMKKCTAAASRQICHGAAAGQVVVMTQALPSVERYPDTEC